MDGTDQQVRFATVAGTVAAAVLLAVGLVVALTTGDGGDDETAGQAPRASTETQESPEAPGQSTDPAEPQPRGGLPIDVPYENQPCSGALIVVIASTGTPSDYAKTIRSAAAAVPDTKYLRTDRSCETFNQRDDGHRIYAAYIGPFDGIDDACQARTATGVASSYVRTLSVERTLREICSCHDEPGDLPALTPKSQAAPTLEQRLRVYDLQAMLYQAGFNAANVLNGAYDDQTIALVRLFKRARGLHGDGFVNARVWGRLQEEGCP